jgi:UDP-N-acetylmuramoyl-tripeptide--D-alanyl-D-alanine ligase
MHLNKQFIQTIVPHAVLGAQDVPLYPTFSVDTRTLQPGDIFIAIQGQHVNGHDFIDQALQKNAGGIIAGLDHQEVIEKKYKKELKNKFVLFVPNTTQALIELAKSWRQQFTIPIVGVTGSMGKTSTKEMIAAMMQASGKQYIASYGNQNTAIGASLHILRLNSSHAFAVFEMGIGPDENMSRIADVVRPTLAVITAIAHAHVETFGSLENIATEKRKICSYFNPENICIINGDVSVLTKASYKHPVVKFGTKLTNQFQVRNIKIQNNSLSFIAKIYDKKYSVLLPTVHAASAMHVIAGLAVAYFLHIPLEGAIQAAQEKSATKGRFEFVPTSEQGIMIHDAYNANVESMKAGLQAFDHYETKRKKVAVIGDMRELADKSVGLHKIVGRFLAKLKTIDHIFLVGDMVDYCKDYISEPQLVAHVKTAQEVIPLLAQYINQDTIVYFKASNGVGLGKVIQHFQEL